LSHSTSLWYCLFLFLSFPVECKMVFSHREADSPSTHAFFHLLTRSFSILITVFFLLKGHKILVRTNKLKKFVLQHGHCT
jgi:hypothetical protein